ncbi:MAG: hypothetical protein K0R72_1188 [Clostridia bacterium]|jgi:hypothetical protein|nr:hypothetical protein [Clostridia bacterium]
MIISTAKEKPLSIFFFIFNFLTFWILEISLVGNITKQVSIILVYIITIVLSLLTGLIYAAINMYFTYKVEKKIMSKSTYVREYGASLFMGYNSIFLFKLKDDIHCLSLNKTHLYLTQYPRDRREYITELRTRLFLLKEMDIICIYFNKYIHSILNSVLFFVIWQICMVSEIKNGAIIQIAIVLCSYYIINKFFTNLTKKIMIKRDLELFLVK